VRGGDYHERITLPATAALAQATKLFAPAIDARASLFALLRHELFEEDTVRVYRNEDTKRLSETSFKYKAGYDFTAIWHNCIAPRAILEQLVYSDDSEDDDPEYRWFTWDGTHDPAFEAWAPQGYDA